METRTEEWRAVAGYEGLYEVSNLGRVRSLGRTINRMTRWGTVKPYTIKPRILKPLHSQGDYCYVHLFDKDGTSTNHKVHRLVAKAFVPNPDNLNEVNHIDEDKDNNRADNLEWCSSSYNHCYGTTIERAASKIHRAVCQFDKNDRLIREFVSVTEAAKAVGTSTTQISGCCKGKTKSAKGYRWKYKE